MSRIFYIVLSDVEIVGEFKTLQEAKNRIKNFWSMPKIYKCEEVEVKKSDIKGIVDD